MSMPLRSELFHSSGKEKRSEEADSHTPTPYPYPTYLTMVEVCPWRGKPCVQGWSVVHQAPELGFLRLGG